jgi:hypothetical protein
MSYYIKGGFRHYFYYVRSAAEAMLNPQPLRLAPALARSVSLPYSGPSKRTKAKRINKRHPRRGPGNCGRNRG